MDHYMAVPVDDFDLAYSAFKSAAVKRVPILRIFGSTQAGQKVCLHLHGLFPYLYVPVGQNNPPGYIYRLAASLDKAINLSSTGQETSDEGLQHVFKIVEVTGRPFYGYHSREHRYYKIYLYNPWSLKKACDLLASGGIMGQVLQPHYGHIPFTLQFMMDFNLQGMSLIHLSHAKFRRTQVSDASESEDWSQSSNPLSQRLFNVAEMPSHMLMPESVQPVSTCPVEVDAVAADILNSNADLLMSSDSFVNEGKKSGNPGLEFIWEDERLRRLSLGIDIEQDPLKPPVSPPRTRKPSAMTSSEQFWTDQFSEALSALNNISTTTGADDPDPDSTANFLVETPNDSFLPSATSVEEHIASLSLSVSFSESRKKKRTRSSNEEEDSNKSNYFDETLVQEDLLSQSQVVDSDEDDLEEVVNMLQGLQKERLEKQDIIDQDRVDTLEMSQIIWDEPVCDDDVDPPQRQSSSQKSNTADSLWQEDSFWDNYDFDSILDD